jgi:PAS domain S-box-containing protein
MTTRPRILLHVPAAWDPAHVAAVLAADARDVSQVAPDALVKEHSDDPAALVVLGVPAGGDPAALVAQLPKGPQAPSVLVLHDQKDAGATQRLRGLGIHGTLPYVPGDDAGLLRTVDNLLETSALRNQLAQSEAQYAELLQNTRDPIYILGPTQFIFVNRAFTELYGYAAEDICNPGFDYMRLIAPESRPMILERARLAALGEPLPPRYEFMALNKAGQRLDVSVSVSYIVYNAQPSSLGVLQDITARKQYEKALLRRNRELAVLNDLAATVARAPDLNAVLEMAVERLIAVMGFSAAGISLLQATAPGTRTGIYQGANAAQLEALQRLPVGEGLIGVAIRTGDVQVVHDLFGDPRASTQEVHDLGFKSAVCVPIQARDRVLGCAVGLCVDRREFGPEELSLLLSIGHQLGTAVERAALYDNREVAVKRLMALDEMARALSSTLNLHEVFQVAAAQVQQVLHASTVEIYVMRPRKDGASTLETVLRGDGVHWEEPGTLLPRGSGLAWKVVDLGRPVVLRPDADPSNPFGPPGTTFAAGAPLVLESQAVGCLLVGFDGERSSAEEAREFLGSVSAHLALASRNARMFSELDLAYQDLKETKDKLVLQEKLGALGEMSAGVAHDFNNILGAILGRSQLLKTFIQDPNLLKSVEVIERAALDGAATVRRIQEFSRVGGEEDLRPLDLDEVASEAVELTQARWKDRSARDGLKVDVVLDLGHPPAVAGNAQQLREVLTNLIHNACDAMPQGGTITLSTGLREDRAFLRLRDTGTGIPPDVRSRIFDPFFTTKGVKGTGLGLSVSYGIVQRHRGEFEVDSVMGQGTTFTIWLPLPRHDAPVAAGRVSSPALPVLAGGGARVLVVDDEESIRDVLVDMLRAADHNVECAVDGPSALERLDALVKDGLDMVFTDLGMPGMSGWELATAVKARYPTLPVGLITGWGASLDADKMQSHGVDLVVPKPFKFEQVTSLVAEALELARSRRGPGAA